MRSRSVCAWFLTLALLAGFALHGVQAAPMKAMTPVAAMQASMPDGGCGGCDDGGNTSSPCLLSCAGGFIPVLPKAAEPPAGATLLAYALADFGEPSLREAPDPFPPKNPVLS